MLILKGVRSLKLNLKLFFLPHVLVAHCSVVDWFVSVVHSGTHNTYSMPVILSFWGKEENRKAVNEYMARRGYKLNTGGIMLTGRQTHTRLSSHSSDSIQDINVCWIS